MCKYSFFVEKNKAHGSPKGVCLTSNSTFQLLKPILMNLTCENERRDPGHRA